MKYLILPVMKFIWAIMLSVISIFYYVFGLVVTIIISIIQFVWTFKTKYIRVDGLVVKNFLGFEASWKDELRLSPYYNYSDSKREFLTYFHYIWNIQRPEDYVRS